MSKKQKVIHCPTFCKGGHPLSAKEDSLFILQERDKLLASVGRMNEKRACISSSELIEKAKLMFSDLQINYEIGSGSCGIAHGGILNRVNRDYSTCVAVKRIKEKDDRDNVEAFFVELKMLYFIRLMKVKNVQYLYGAVYENGKPVSIVTFFVGKNNESTTSSRVLRLDRKFEMQFVNSLRFCCSLAAGLIGVHKIGILHNDMKPNNVLVNLEDWSAIITDFGRACFVHNAKRKPKKREQSTYYWIAPEVNSCLSAPSPYSDVFSIGYVIQYGIARFGDCKSRKLKILADKCQSQDSCERPTLRFIEHFINNLPECYLTYRE